MESLDPLPGYNALRRVGMPDTRARIGVSRDIEGSAVGSVHARTVRSTIDIAPGHPSPRSHNAGRQLRATIQVQ